MNNLPIYPTHLDAFLQSSHPRPIEYLKETLELTVKDFGKHYLLDYNQIHTPKFHKIADNCRGVVIEKDSLKVVRRMFKRFYNLNESISNDKKIDYKNAVIENKEDGSIIGLWYNSLDQQWEVGTRGVPYGDNSIQDSLNTNTLELTFKQIFIKCYEQTTNVLFDSFLKKLDINFTYIFELCSLYNKNVKTYATPEIYLIGAIETATNLEQDYKQLDTLALEFQVLRPIRHTIEFDQLAIAANSLKNLDEGFVVVDNNFNRLKVKSIHYVTAHYIRGNGLNFKKALYLILEGEVDEFITYFPEYSKYILELSTNIDNFKKTIIETYLKYNHLETQDKFAFAVKDYTYKAILFSLRKEKKLEDIILNLTDNAKIKLFEHLKPNF